MVVQQLVAAWLVHITEKAISPQGYLLGGYAHDAEDQTLRHFYIVHAWPKEGH